MRYLYVVFAVAGWAWLVAVFGFLAVCLRGCRGEAPGFEVIQNDEKQP